VGKDGSGILDKDLILVCLAPTKEEVAGDEELAAHCFAGLRKWMKNNASQ
jgi:hypothetical protein